MNFYDSGGVRSLKILLIQANVGKFILKSLHFYTL